MFEYPTDLYFDSASLKNYLQVGLHLPSYLWNQSVKQWAIIHNTKQYNQL
jgi:hypothetical protein